MNEGRDYSGARENVSTSAPAVLAQKLRAREDVALHRLLEFALPGGWRKGQSRVERIESEEVPMGPRGGAGAAVPHAVEVVGSLRRAVRERGFLGNPLRQGAGPGRTQVPPGASGSSEIRAKLFAGAGASDHSSGGERSGPSQVWRAGIEAPWANARLFSSIVGPPSTGPLPAARSATARGTSAVAGAMDAIIHADRPFTTRRRTPRL